MSLLLYLLGAIGIVGIIVFVVGAFLGFLGAPIYLMLRKDDDDAFFVVTYARIAAFYGFVVSVIAFALLRGLTQ